MARQGSQCEIDLPLLQEAGISGLNSPCPHSFAEHYLDGGVKARPLLSMAGLAPEVSHLFPGQTIKAGLHRDHTLVHHEADRTSSLVRKHPGAAIRISEHLGGRM